MGIFLFLLSDQYVRYVVISDTILSIYLCSTGKRGRPTIKGLQAELSKLREQILEPVSADATEENR
jgi:hypothetical protein